MNNEFQHGHHAVSSETCSSHEAHSHGGDQHRDHVLFLGVRISQDTEDDEDLEAPPAIALPSPCYDVQVLPCMALPGMANPGSLLRLRERSPGPPQGGRSGASGAAALVGVALCCASAPTPSSAEAHSLRGWRDL